MIVSTVRPNTKQALEILTEQVENIINPMGYEVVTLEDSGYSKARTLTLFIDFFDSSSTQTEENAHRIGLDDCVKVNNAVDELFENTSLVEGTYTLDVSSPGIERPLRKRKDFERFIHRKIRVHTYRPLEIDETENKTYTEKNPKQKNFVGRLEGLSSGHEKVLLQIDSESVRIPFEMITKAHLVYEG